MFLPTTSLVSPNLCRRRIKNRLQRFGKLFQSKVLEAMRPKPTSCRPLFQKRLRFSYGARWMRLKFSTPLFQKRLWVWRFFRTWEGLSIGLTRPQTKRRRESVRTSRNEKTSKLGERFGGGNGLGGSGSKRKILRPKGLMWV